MHRTTNFRVILIALTVSSLGCDPPVDGPVEPERRFLSGTDEVQVPRDGLDGSQDWIEQDESVKDLASCPGNGNGNGNGNGVPPSHREALWAATLVAARAVDPVDPATCPYDPATVDCRGGLDDMAQLQYDLLTAHLQPPLAVDAAVCADVRVVMSCSRQIAERCAMKRPRATKGRRCGYREAARRLAGKCMITAPASTLVSNLVSLPLDHTNADITNPERGFYRYVKFLRGLDYSWIPYTGVTLVGAQARLAEFRDGPIDEATLAEIEDDFRRIREAGLKVVLRFSYVDATSLDDAPMSIILLHLSQLAPILRDNRDVLAVLQAGFIGQWGEWHNSAYGNLDSPEIWQPFLDELLAELPTERMIQLRRPTFKTDDYTAPLTEAEAFTGTPAARIGHHDDCFLGNDTDFGTYPADAVDEWKGYIHAESQFLPIGGETCAVSRHTQCGEALEQVEYLGYSYLNEQWHPVVLASWDLQGCKDDIHRYLGHRFTLDQAQITPDVPPGGELDLDLVIGNEGYAAPFNERPVYAIIERNGQRHDALLSIDPRRWNSGDTHAVARQLRIPADAEPGSWRLGLWLPDAADSLRDDPRYAIQLANDGTWDATTGINWLTRGLSVDPAAPGPTDPDAFEFAEITE